MRIFDNLSRGASFAGVFPRVSEIFFLHFLYLFFCSTPCRAAHLEQAFSRGSRRRRRNYYAQDFFSIFLCLNFLLHLFARRRFPGGLGEGAAFTTPLGLGRRGRREVGRVRGCLARLVWIELLP